MVELALRHIHRQRQIPVRHLLRPFPQLPANRLQRFPADTDGESSIFSYWKKVAEICDIAILPSPAQQ